MTDTDDRKPYVYGGIDPGVKGAIVMRAGPYTRTVRAADYHTVGGFVDAPTLRARLLAAFIGVRSEALTDGVDVAVGCVVVEDYALIPEQGLASQAKAARNAGAIYGCVAGLGWPIVIGRTHSGRGGWRQIAGIVKGRHADIKRATIAHVRSTLPALDLQPGRCRTDQDGIADAAGMSLAAERLVLSGVVP